MAVSEDSPLQIEVWVSTAPRDTRCSSLQLKPGSSVGDAVQASGLLDTAASLDATSVVDGLKSGRWALAVWGRKVPWGHVLRDGDRVELLRALTVDPKEARRVRYRAQGEKLPKGFHRSKKPADPTNAP